ncbi:uncharacterized protein LOC142233678 [Haematobia irritans]|uniref:uncharacterized protein LOC142233678 n=1 Tax=Haematobia irritans TaxID=7368 RepID=UPI003F505925
MKLTKEFWGINKRGRDTDRYKQKHFRVQLGRSIRSKLFENKMRAFIVLCLVAVACADKLGYDYQPVGHSDSGLSFTPGSGSSAGFSGGNAGFSGGNAGFSGGSTGASYDAPAPAAEFEKEFYTFTADDSEFDDPNAAQRAASSVKQGVRVIFIKGPENKGLENAALALAKSASQQRTAIYVLNKQADIGDLANKLNAINSGSNNKPEVHFVKYRTAEDAANAQRAIQGQYDSLGGKSQNINGGVAPVLNFASQAPARAAPAPQAPQSSYLPAAFLRRFRLRIYSSNKMRAFIVLCLVAIASAQSGYNYQPVGNGDGAGAVSGGSSGASYDAPSTYSAPAELEKEFYTFSAPEGEFDDAGAAERAANSVKQGLRVVFIKGPENKGLEDAALALAKSAGQQQTAIYVLNKQADIGDLANKLNVANSAKNSKPEVHFVKYRTAEDAANAQRTIQSQYDSLGGNSHSINGGVAPVLNFASQAPARAGPAPQTPQNSYLPSSLFRTRF